MAELPVGYGAVLFALLAALLCAAARRLISKALPAGGNARRYAGEAVCTFQLVTGMLEGDVVMEVMIPHETMQQKACSDHGGRKTASMVRLNVHVVGIHT